METMAFEFHHGGYHASLVTRHADVASFHPMEYKP
jgi:hypothetical protein